MFAYNAGRGRLRRWLADGEGLPDDLLLESLSIEETRQYGRNILQAAVMYGELYNGMKADSIVDEIMGESGALAKTGDKGGASGN
jgi:soluble lytic murein transglycosylase